LDQQRQRPFGRLRIHSSPLAAPTVIAPIWERFLSTYPDVRLDLWVDMGPIDIVANSFDAGIGPKRWAAADMIAVRLRGPTKIAVVGAPKYFERRPPPRTLDDLLSHSCIQYRFATIGSTVPWSFERGGRTKQMSLSGGLTVNVPDLVVRAAVDGLGIAYTAEELAAPFLRTGQLVRVLEDFSPSVEAFFLFYPGHRQVPAALRAFIDTMRAPKSAHGKHSPKVPILTD
jgi:DNA-binding transcriptional LysR family regulator